MKLENIKLDVRDYIATVTLARPPVNATNRAMRGEITQVFDAMTDRDDVRVVILTAEGKMFCAGADIKERTQLTGEPGEYGALNRLVREMFYSIMECSKPVIAAVNGRGARRGHGADVVLRHPPRERGRDLRHAGSRRRARRRRQVPAAAPRPVEEPAHAAHRPAGARDGAVPARRARGMRAAPRADAGGDGARAEIASKSPLAVRMLKESFNAVENLTLRDGYRLEQNMTVALSRTDDAREAREAFVEKRKPVFKGR